MGNYLALCTIGDHIQSKDTLLKEQMIKGRTQSTRLPLFSTGFGKVLNVKEILQIIRQVDGKILEFTNSLIVRDLLVSYPNSYVGMFKEATQGLPLDYKLKVGEIYYLLPSLPHHTTSSSGTSNEEMDRRTATKTTIKVVITKEQLQQILSKQGGVEELLLGVVPNKKVLSYEGSSSSSFSTWFPKLESIPEGNDVVC